MPSDAPMQFEYNELREKQKRNTFILMFIIFVVPMLAAFPILGNGSAKREDRKGRRRRR